MLIWLKEEALLVIYNDKSHYTDEVKKIKD